jgi:hypothetical protein
VVGIGRFIIVQATACFPAGAAEVLRRGLKEIQEASVAQFARGFAELGVAQREQVLTDYEARAASTKGSALGSGSNVNPFRLMKELTLLGYFTSEPGATQALRYLPVPGGYKGSVKLGPGERSWAL